MRHRCFGSGTIGALHRCAFRDSSLQFVFFSFLNNAPMKTTVQKQLDLRIDVRLHRSGKQFVEFRAFGCRQSMTQRFEFAPVFLGEMIFPSYQ